MQLGRSARSRYAALSITNEILILPWHVVGEVTSRRLPVAQLAGGETARYSGIDACFVKLNYHESKAERRKQWREKS